MIIPHFLFCFLIFWIWKIKKDEKFIMWPHFTKLPTTKVQVCTSLIKGGNKQKGFLLKNSPKKPPANILFLGTLKFQIH